MISWVQLSTNRVKKKTKGAKGGFKKDMGVPKLLLGEKIKNLMGQSERKGLGDIIKKRGPTRNKNSKLRKWRLGNRKKKDHKGRENTRVHSQKVGCYGADEIAAVRSFT